MASMMSVSSVPLTTTQKQVIKDMKSVVKMFAQSGTGENQPCHGILAVAGEIELLTSKACIINNPDLDYRGKGYYISDCLTKGSPARRALALSLTQDGGFLVELSTGLIVCGGLAVRDLRNGVEGVGGMRFMAASSVAMLGPNGSFSIKVSEDSCGCQKIPLSKEAKLEIFNFTNQVTYEAFDEPVRFYFFIKSFAKNIANNNK